jgi:hypothetical protein
LQRKRALMGREGRYLPDHLLDFLPVSSPAAGR